MFPRGVKALALGKGWERTESCRREQDSNQRRLKSSGVGTDTNKVPPPAGHLIPEGQAPAGTETPTGRAEPQEGNARRSRRG